jgi:hypothetical protein
VLGGIGEARRPPAARFSSPRAASCAAPSAAAPA